MHEEGLVEVEDASARFVNEATRAPGAVVLCAMEGSRPLLVEVQALVAPSELVPPRRVANGVDRNRLALVLAVLARHAGMSLGSRRRLRVRRRRRAGRRAGRRPRDRAGARIGRQGHRPGRRASRWPPSASSASPASCGTSGTPTAALAEAREFGLDERHSARPIGIRTLRQALGGALPRRRTGLHRPLRAANGHVRPETGTISRRIGAMPYAGDDVAELEAPAGTEARSSPGDGGPRHGGTGGTRQHRPGRNRRPHLHWGVGGAQLPAVLVASSSTSTTRRRCSTSWPRWTARSSSPPTAPRSCGRTSS